MFATTKTNKPLSYSPNQVSDKAIEAPSVKSGLFYLSKVETNR